MNRSTSRTLPMRSAGVLARLGPWCAILVCILAVAPADASEALQEQIDRSITGSLTVAERLEMLDDVFARLPDDADSTLVGAAYLARGYALLEGGRLDEGMATIMDALERVSIDEAPDQYVHLRSMRAALLLARGDTEQSVAEYSALFETLPAGLDPGIAVRTRANYASALFESGRTLAAAETFRQLIPEAESLGDDRLALGLANNLLVILIQLDLHDDAKEWLGRLSALRERSTDTAILDSIRLHELELQRIFGDPAGAAAGLAAFIETTDDDRNASVLGNAYEYLADAERERGRLEASETSARQAVELLRSVPWELAEAQISLARTLVARGRFAEALDVLDEISEPAQGSAARFGDIAGLRLEAQLRQRGLDDSTAELQRLLTTLETNRQQDARQYIRYYDAKLEAQRQELKISQMREAEAVLAAQAEAAEVRAGELEARQDVLRTNRNLTIALIILAAGALMALLYALNRREYQRKLLANEQEQNRALSEQIEEKSEALKRQLEEQADMERALNEKKQIELIGEIAGNVAHDLNNLLQVVYSANERVETLLEDAELREVLKASNRSLNYASDITRQLLAFARQQELETRVIDVAALVRESERLFQSAAGEEVRLEFDLPAEAGALVDPAKLTTVVLNLLRNSVDAMPAGGTVQISVTNQSLVHPQQLGWVALAPGDYVVIEVADNGEGMDAETLGKALQPFYSTKTQESGTGLGLSTVYGFARQTGGDMRIESVPGEGTCVTVVLPAAELTLTSVAPGEGRRSRPWSPGHALVVEDNDLVAEAICSLLAHVGLDATLMPSADAAVEELERSAVYDFVLTDVRMPGKRDGYDLARWIAQHRPDLNVILMSGYNDHLDEDIPFPLINKPFTLDQLLAVLEAGKRAERKGAPVKARPLATRPSP